MEPNPDEPEFNNRLPPEEQFNLDDLNLNICLKQGLKNNKEIEDQMILPNGS